MNREHLDRAVKSVMRTTTVVGALLIFLVFALHIGVDSPREHSTVTIEEVQQ